MREVILRPLRREDVSKLAVAANDSEVARNMRDDFPHPYTESDANILVDYAIQHSPTIVLGIEYNDVVVGAVGIHILNDIYKKNAEIGYWIGQPFWGKGITTQAVIKMVDYVFETFDINRIFACPFDTNVASHKVLKKAGFEIEGSFKGSVYKGGKYKNELIFAILKK